MKFLFFTIALCFVLEALAVPEPGLGSGNGESAIEKFFEGILSFFVAKIIAFFTNLSAHIGEDGVKIVAHWLEVIAMKLEQFLWG